MSLFGMLTEAGIILLGELKTDSNGTDVMWSKLGGRLQDGIVVPRTVYCLCHTKAGIDARRFGLESSTNLGPVSDSD